MYKSFPAEKLKYLLLTIFLSCIIIPGHSNILQVADTVKLQVEDSGSYKQRTFDAEDLRRGERLFYGLVYLKDKSMNCAGCHNTRETDTLNWNPDALEISKKYLEKSAKDLSKVLLKRRCLAHHIIAEALTTFCFFPVLLPLNICRQSLKNHPLVRCLLKVQLL